MKPIPNRVAEVDAYMEEKVGLGVSFDLGVRRIKVLRKDVHLYYINGLTDTEYIIGILDSLIHNKNAEIMTCKSF